MRFLVAVPPRLAPSCWLQPRKSRCCLNRLLGCLSVRRSPMRLPLLQDLFALVNYLQHDLLGLSGCAGRGLVCTHDHCWSATKGSSLSRISRLEHDTYFQTFSTPPTLLELWPYRLPKAWCSPGCFLLCDAILLLVIRHTSAEPVCKKSTRGEVLPLLLCDTGRCPEDQRQRKGAVPCKRDSGHGKGRS